MYYSWTKIYGVGAIGKPTNIMLLKGYTIIPTLNNLLLYTQLNISLNPFFEKLLIAVKVINTETHHTKVQRVREFRMLSHKGDIYCTHLKIEGSLY